MQEHAICYTATSGHLFQTAVSASQARINSAREVDVVLVSFADPSSPEADAVRAYCESRGVYYIDASVPLPKGLHPAFGRFLLGSISPAEVKQILYMDGDTQVVADITPLICAPLESGQILGVRDPMVLIRELNPRLGIKIDGWWDESQIPPATRVRYINSGVLRLSTETMRSIEGLLLNEARAVSGGRKFLDQDAVNLKFSNRIALVSTAWNFPGFLLGTQFQEIARPRIIHFMSNPRPWHGALHPWGTDYYRPYGEAADSAPGMRRLWNPHSGRLLFRSTVQQEWKKWTEGRYYRTERGLAIFSRLEASTRQIS